ncbi:MAG: 1-acyl-sn-glycerol-3-phosphate acyltransferase [Mycoplasmataceae bacterium]|nr:1-acyl-sn-glycerol-3-phosphate acyltransferase [Mycoplasmataceae bacterium]
MSLVKIKAIISLPSIGWANHRARKHGKKYLKFADEEKYPQQWRNDYVMKKQRKLLKKLGVKLEVEGWENLPKGTALLAPNHQSLLDPAVIFAALKNPQPGSDNLNKVSVFLAKKELEKNYKLKGYARLTNTFYIDRTNPRASLKAMDEMTEHAKKNHKYMVIFPEGTRSKDGDIKEFKGGAFRVAKKGFMPIVPVTINNSLSITNLKRKKLTVTVIFHKPLKPMSFITKDTKTIASTVQKIVESRFVKAQGTKSSREAKI